MDCGGTPGISGRPYPLPLDETPLPGEPIPIFTDDDIDPKANVFNIVFVAHNYKGEVNPLLTFDSAQLLIRQFIEEGFFKTAPFSEEKEKFQFWFYQPTAQEALVESASHMCSSQGDFDQVDGRIDVRLKNLGFKHVRFMNLIHTDQCRDQAGWTDLTFPHRLTEEESTKDIVFDLLGVNRIVDDISDMASHDRKKLKELLTHPLELKQWLLDRLDFKTFAEILAHRFHSPRTYIQVTNEEIGSGILSPRRRKVWTHELGHTYRLWDLYAEGDQSGVAKIIAYLNQDIEILDSLDLTRLIPGLKTPEVKVNLFEKFMESDALKKAFGLPVGFPHCAPNKKIAEDWAKALHVADPGFNEAGCLYVDNSNPLGPLRAEDSIMYHSVAGVFGKMETAWMKWLFTCELHPTNEICDDLSPLGISPQSLF